jgi:hypothetical protein
VEAGDLKNGGGWETQSIGAGTHGEEKVFKESSKTNYFNLKHLIKTFIVQYYGELE